jgi:oligopeptide transport system ATP-binding protein
MNLQDTKDNGIQQTILDVKNLRTHFHTRSGIVKAVDGLSFSLKRGECLGLVGESGSGKSVSMMSLLGLVPTPPARVSADYANFHNQDLMKLSQGDLRKIRGKKISMIFQDPMTSLNPYLKISTQLCEAILEHENVSHKEALDRSLEALNAVGIPDPSMRIHQYPHEFSGGMRQRVVIAMGIVTQPDIIIADEPTTALDVTVQAQILELLMKIQDEYKTGLILITHDLGVIAGIADKVMIMYAGRPIESGLTEDIFYRSKHPYTRGLLKSIPSITAESNSKLYSIPGLPPDPSRVPEGCSFAPRCEFKKPSCTMPMDVPRRTFENSHSIVCHLEKGIVNA